MSLDKDIVIRSEYSIQKNGRGSRGSTLNKYVTSYMSRLDATEVLITTPVSNDRGVLDYSTRYVNREKATEQLYEQGVVSDFAVGYTFEQQDRLNWRVFSNDNLSMSHDELVNKSELIQKCLEKGLTVIKPIISFTTNYLKETGVLPDDFEMAGPGSFRGNIDQLKLRKAVTSGFQSLTRIGGFVKPLWLASIQVDTSHVHVHGLVVDQENGEFRKTADGTSRGKINKQEKRAMRRGIHHSLLSLKPLKSYRKLLDNERQNVVSFTKEQTYRTIGENSELQSLLSLLPKNKRKWRYGSNSREMRRCDDLAQKIVYDMWANHGESSGYKRMQQRLETYAQEKLDKDNTSGLTFDGIYEKGMSLLLKRSINGLYRTLAQVEPSELTVVTPSLLASALDDAELVQSARSDTDDLLMYQYRVRKYDQRKTKRTQNVNDLSQAIDRFDETAINHGVHPDAMSMRFYYEYELAYNMRLVDKYRYFFRYDGKKEKSVLPTYLAERDKLMNVYERLAPQVSFIADMVDSTVYEVSGIPKETAYQESTAFSSYVSATYGLAQGDRFLDSIEFDRFADKVQDDVAQYCYNLRGYLLDGFDAGVLGSDDWRDAVNVATLDDSAGISLENVISNYNMSFIPPAEPKLSINRLDKESFDRVKFLDVHELLIDNESRHLAIGSVWADAFDKATAERLYYKQLAQRYVDGTKQHNPLMVSWFDDVESMVQANNDIQKGDADRYASMSDVDVMYDSALRNVASVRLDSPLLYNIFQGSVDSISFDEIVDEMDVAQYNEL